jgi:hypothetical protein
MERMDGSAERCEIPASGGCISRPSTKVPNEPRTSKLVAARHG